MSAPSRSQAPTEGGDPMQGAPALPVGALVARRYRLESVLGVGGFAWVYAATDLLGGERVAVKIQLLSPGIDLRRIRRELAAMRLLRIPGVVTLLDDGVEGDHYYLVMELVEGAPFSGAGAWPTIAEVVVGLLETVARIHAAGVVHRDLKPGNVLVTPEGRPVVLDFGLAMGPGVGRSVAPVEGVVGTPGYIAPEQIQGGNAGPQADLYAVGAMVYEALCGRTPLQGDTWQETLMARLVADPEPIGQRVPGLDPAVAALVDRLVAREPGARPASASDALAVLAGAPGVRRAPVTWPWVPGDRAGTGGAPETSRLSAADLRSLIAGPERLLHLQEDGARLVLERTGGLPGNVERELAAWVRAGLAAWHEGRLSLGRGALERLRASPPVRHSEASGGADLLSALGEAHRDLIGWLELAWPRTQAEHLAAVTGLPSWRVRGYVEALAHLGLLVRSRDGRVAGMAVAGVASAWSEQRRREAHRRLAAALPAGAEGRLHHLVAAGELAEVGAEAAARGLALAGEGLLGPAAAALEEGLGPARLHEDAAGEGRLLELLCEVSLSLGTEHALDRALYELERAWTRSPRIARLEGLVRASLGAMRAVGQASLLVAESIRPFVEEPLEEGRMVARLRAARGCPVAEEERVLADAETWAAGGSPRARALALMWRALYQYRVGRFQEAADTHLAALRVGPPPHLWLAISVNAASALLEAHDLDGAISMAARAATFAARLRHPLQEGRAERVRRVALYRAGRATEPDLDLVEGAEAVGQPDLLAMVCLNEAGVALRGGRLELGGVLASRAAAAWTRMGRTWEGALVRALADGCMGASSPALRREIVQGALECTTAMMPLQALALWATAEPLDAQEQAVVRALADRIPPAAWELRADVLSPREAVELALGRGRLEDLVDARS